MAIIKKNTNNKYWRGCGGVIQGWELRSIFCINKLEESILQTHFPFLIIIFNKQRNESVICIA